MINLRVIIANFGKMKEGKRKKEQLNERKKKEKGTLMWQLDGERKNGQFLIFMAFYHS